MDPFVSSSMEAITCLMLNLINYKYFYAVNFAGDVTRSIMVIIGDGILSGLVIPVLACWTEHYTDHHE